MFKFNDDAQPETDPNESLSSLWNLDEINSESTATFSDLLNADLFDTFGTGSSGTGDPLVNDGYESPSWILSQSLEILPEDLAVPADSSFGPFNLNSGETYHGLEDVELDEVKEEWFSEADFNSTMEWVNEEIERGKDIVASAAAGSSSEHEGSHAAPAYHFIKEEWFSDAEFNSTMEWVNEEIEKGRQLEGPEPAAAGASTEESQKVPAYHFVKAFLQPTTSQWSVQWIGERPNQFIRGEYIPCKNKESEVCNGIHCLLDEKGSCLVRSSACPYSSLNADESLTPSRHVNLHLRPFLCTFSSCRYELLGFPLAADLERHQRTQHGDWIDGPSDISNESKSTTQTRSPRLNWFPCPHETCPRMKKPFIRLDNLLAHRRSVHGERIEKRRGRPVTRKYDTSAL